MYVCHSVNIYICVMTSFYCSETHCTGAFKRSRRASFQRIRGSTRFLIIAEVRSRAQTAQFSRPRARHVGRADTVLRFADPAAEAVSAGQCYAGGGLHENGALDRADPQRRSPCPRRRMHAFACPRSPSLVAKRLLLHAHGPVPAPRGPDEAQEYSCSAACWRRYSQHKPLLLGTVANAFWTSTRRDETGWEIPELT